VENIPELLADQPRHMTLIFDDLNPLDFINEKMVGTTLLQSQRPPNGIDIWKKMSTDNTAASLNRFEILNGKILSTKR
jgi:hypothetical protein